MICRFCFVINWPCGFDQIIWPFCTYLLITPQGCCDNQIVILDISVLEIPSTFWGQLLIQ